MSFPPMNDESTAVNVGLAAHVLVKVAGVTVWYPKLVVWTSTLYFPLGKYPPVGTTEYPVELTFVTVAGYNVEVGVFYELKYWNQTVSTDAVDVTMWVFPVDWETLEL